MVGRREGRGGEEEEEEGKGGGKEGGEVEEGEWMERSGVNVFTHLDKDCQDGVYVPLLSWSISTHISHVHIITHTQHTL